MDDNTNDGINHVQGTTPDFQTEFAKQLSEFAPELVTDGKIDSKKLRELLDGDEADDSERFGLFWPGKKRAMRAAQEPTTATLKPAKEESKDWDTTQNLFIEGDNLEVLKVLQKHYHNKIKMIYIDPPYNTGKDFVYPDNFKEGLASYLEFTKQVDEEGRSNSTNSDTDGRYHSNWLTMMYPRLKLARNLLTDDGVIFLSIDDNEQSNLKKICDEIFGENNFVAVFSWKSKLGKVGTTSTVSTTQEYILCYARNISRASFKMIKKETDGRKENLRQWGQADRREDRPSMHYPITLDSITVYPKRPDGTDGRWRIGKESAEQLAKNGMLELVKNKNGEYGVYRNFPAGTSVTPFETVLDATVGTTAKGSLTLGSLGMQQYFDYPKPIELISFFANLVTSDSDLILDFFSGSGTTAHAIMQLNAVDGEKRKSIQVQLPEPTDPKSEAYKSGYKKISDISKERIRRASKKIKTDYAEKLAERESSLDTGFRVYKLSDSNFTKWSGDSATDKDSLQQHLLDLRESSNDASSEEDLLTEVLLKQGISLTAPIAHNNVEGLSVWTVGDNLVCAYLNEKQKPSLDQLRAVAASEPAKLIMLEDAFQGDDELKTNLVQICKSQKIELWTV